MKTYVPAFRLRIFLLILSSREYSGWYIMTFTIQLYFNLVVSCNALSELCNINFIVLSPQLQKFQFKIL
jgi:hypothetical protein